MTTVWQLSAAQECMDGMLVLIKEIFFFPVIFHRLSVAPINSLLFNWWDLALNTPGWDAESLPGTACKSRPTLKKWPHLNTFLYRDTGRQRALCFENDRNVRAYSWGQRQAEASAFEKVLAWRWSVPQLMAVYIIYNAGRRLLIHGVSCPPGMCSCILFDMLGNTAVVIFLL